VFPDGELTGSGRIIAAMQDNGLEVRHSENLREHYAFTLREWSTNLREHWSACVGDVGVGTARVWVAGFRTQRGTTAPGVGSQTDHNWDAAVPSSTTAVVRALGVSPQVRAASE